MLGTRPASTRTQKTRDLFAPAIRELANTGIATKDIVHLTVFTTNDPTAEVFAIAADAGLGCTIHAGEWAGPESVRAALELPITRIAHGVRAIEDPALVDELAAREMVLDTCPTSNVVLGVLAAAGLAMWLRSHVRRRQSRL